MTAAAGRPASARSPARRAALAAPDGAARASRLAAHDGAAVLRASRRAAPRRPRKAPLYTLAVVVFGIAIVVGAGALPSGDGASRRIVGGPAAGRGARAGQARRSASSSTPAPTGLTCEDAHPPARITSRTGRTSPAPTSTSTTAVLLRDDASPSSRPTPRTATSAKASPEARKHAKGRDRAQRPTEARHQDGRRDVRAEGRAAPGSRPRQGGPSAARTSEAQARCRSDADDPRPSLVDRQQPCRIGAMDTLIAGAGRRRRSAPASMKLLGTIEAVKVTDRGATLEHPQHGLPGRLRRDAGRRRAQTGVIQKVTGGVVGKAPVVIVDLRHQARRRDGRTSRLRWAGAAGGGASVAPASPACGSGGGRRLRAGDARARRPRAPDREEDQRHGDHARDARRARTRSPSAPSSRPRRR